MEEKKNELSRKEKRTLMIVSLAIVLALVFGISYAYFMAQDTSAEQQITTAKLGIEFDDGTTNDDTVTLASNIHPVNVEDVLTDTTNVGHKNFKLKKTENSEDVYAKIELIDITMTDKSSSPSTKLAEYDFKWALYKGTTEKIATGDFGGKSSGSIVLATNQLINSTDGIEYNLYIWINETGINQSSMMGQTFSARIKASGTDVQENTLANKILTGGTKYITNATYEYVGCVEGCVSAMGEEACYTQGACEGRNAISVEYSDLDTTIYETGASGVNNGLFVQQGDATKSEMGFPTYYYRGENLTNYVSFAGNLWRVVRINEDGSIKLINEETISSVWNSTGGPKYINDDGTNSEMKTAVETWYNTNIGSNNTLNSKVVMSSFCNDISGISNIDPTVTFCGNAYDRLDLQSQPTFVCSSGAINAYSKAGLITADESEYNNHDLIMASSPTSVATLTPSGPYNLFGWASNYNSFSSTIDPEVLIVSNIVINLSSDVTVSTGNGTEETPYVIQ